MNILHINSTDIGGGAARAAYRIHRSLVEQSFNDEITSQMRVISKLSDDPTVAGGPPLSQIPFWRKLQPCLAEKRLRLLKTRNPTLHSIAWPSTGLGRELTQLYLQGQIDLLHLHWLGNKTLSIEEIGNLSIPIVWTLHDQWPFCGAEHYTYPPKIGESSSSDVRFAEGYSATSRPTHEVGPDLNRHTWLRKWHAWRRPFRVVATSTWMLECVKSSLLMANWPTHLIPCPLDLNVWHPFDQHQARLSLNLPLAKPLVLFGALGGTTDYRKGADLLIEALRIMYIQLQGTLLENLQLVVFGQGKPEKVLELGFPIHYIGRLHDDVSLRLLYASADVMVVPSRQEAFGQTASEAQACGTPVVAFRTGGLTDIVKDRVTGVLADPFDPHSLAESIRWVIEDSYRRQKLAMNARQRAERLWNSDQIADQYIDVYRAATSSNINL